MKTKIYSFPACIFLLALSEFAGKQTAIDVGSLPQGAYNCNFTGASFSANQKVIIIH